MSINSFSPDRFIGRISVARIVSSFADTLNNTRMVIQRLHPSIMFHQVLDSL
jgi:hypothetical protein